MVALPSRSILLHLGRQMGWRKIFRWIYDFSPKIATSNSCPSNKGWISNHATGKSAMAPRILSNVLTWMGGKLPPLTLHKKGVVKIQWFLGAEDFHSFFYLGSVFGLNHRGQFFHPFFKPHLRITFFSISKISFRNTIVKIMYLRIATQCLKKSPKMYHLHFQSWHLLSNKYCSASLHSIWRKKSQNSDLVKCEIFTKKNRENLFTS